MSEAAPTPAYDERGSGRPVVFSHGTLMDRTMFDPQVEALAGSYRVIAYDHPARTGGWAEQYSLGDLVDNCIGLLDALEIERCVLAGMSMGGFMAIELALRHPERLDGLIIIDAIAGDARLLILTELAPDRAGPILRRGRAYGDSRFVCGAHNESAVEGGMLSASATMALVRTKPAFQQDLAAARAEIDRLRADPATPRPQGCAAEEALVSQRVMPKLDR